MRSMRWPRSGRSPATSIWVAILRCGGPGLPIMVPSSPASGATPYGEAPNAPPGNLDLYQPNTVRGGHAVALVGYTPDRFIVRNSWGTTGWGAQGFGFASLAYAQAAFTEAYGVSV